MRHAKTRWDDSTARKGTGKFLRWHFSACNQTANVIYRISAIKPRSLVPLSPSGKLKNRQFDARKPDASPSLDRISLLFLLPPSRRGPLPSTYITEMACVVRHNVVGLFSCTNRLFLVALSNTCFWLVRNDGAFECWVKPQPGRCDSATPIHNLYA